ncbi:DUF5110 domain-containing protein [Streptomyces sp. NPDC014983]|uniref:DUF5110 domain-containing protein n=1 Tax=Streptomyces sp. NPDC014983 TaxID=3364933 RepID=UPI0036FC49D0
MPYAPKDTKGRQTRDRHELDRVLYPAAHGTSGCALHEDDGVTRDVGKGAAATPRVRAHRDANGTTVSVGAAEGDHAGKAADRTCRFTVYGGSAPVRVPADGRRPPSSARSFDPAARVTRVTTGSLALDRGFGLRLVDNK